MKQNSPLPPVTVSIFRYDFVSTSAGQLGPFAVTASMGISSYSNHPIPSVFFSISANLVGPNPFLGQPLPTSYPIYYRGQGSAPPGTWQASLQSGSILPMPMGNGLSTFYVTLQYAVDFGSTPVGSSIVVTNNLIVGGYGFPGGNLYVEGNWVSNKNESVGYTIKYPLPKALF